LIKVALFGGSFDPPHKGHQSIVNRALESLDIERLIIIPAFLNPFKTTSLASARQRLDWCRELFGNDPSIVVSDYEISQGRPVYTSESLRHFQTLYDVKYLIIGADNLPTIDKWHAFEWLDSQIIWAVATRDGHEVDCSRLRVCEILDIDIDISSTHIRRHGDLSGVDETIAHTVASTIKRSIIKKETNDT
jgi:nicotinate-nucleotide adenylyltransferase